MAIKRKKRVQPTQEVDRKKTSPALESMPPTGFLRPPQVLSLYPVSRSTWFEGITSGRYPKAVKLGPRAVGWRVEDIRKLIETGTAA
jgi:predicted DNA-binding transcriptional regulator AlpA